MFRVIKPLNNNGLLALTEEGREAILLGKGIGFGKKSGERIESLTCLPQAKVYHLVTDDENSALQRVNGLDPHAVELAARVLDEARKSFPAMTDDSCCRWRTTSRWRSSAAVAASACPIRCSTTSW